MHEHVGFLETSSLVVKVAAWFFLFLGIVAGAATLLGRVPGYQPWFGLAIIGFYAFAFFFLYLIAKIADLLVKIIAEIKKE